MSHCPTCSCLPAAPPSQPLTGRQALALAAIRDAVAEKGYPPSLRELATAIGVSSPSTVSHVLKALMRKGYIRQDPRRPRALVVLEEAP